MCLFSIFINNFPNTLFNLKTLLLVSTVVAAGSDFNTLRMELIHEIDRVFAWLQVNKITINTDKTTTLIFSYIIFDVNYENELRLNSADIDYVFIDWANFRDPITVSIDLNSVSLCLHQYQW